MAAAATAAASALRVACSDTPVGGVDDGDRRLTALEARAARAVRRHLLAPRLDRGDAVGGEGAHDVVQWLGGRSSAAARASSGATSRVGAASGKRTEEITAL